MSLLIILRNIAQAAFPGRVLLIHGPVTYPVLGIEILIEERHRARTKYAVNQNHKLPARRLAPVEQEEVSD